MATQAMSLPLWPGDAPMLMPLMAMAANPLVWMIVTDAAVPWQGSSPAAIWGGIWNGLMEKNAEARFMTANACDRRP